MYFLCTAKKVRSDMKGWIVSGAGNKWTVRLDVRDLGGHLDSTLRARATTLGYRISAAVPGSLLLFFLWTLVEGFVFSVRCICLLRFMVLRPLLSLSLVYVGLGLLLVKLLCLVDCDWPTLVLF